MRHRRGKSLLPDLDEDEGYDPRADLRRAADARVTKSCSPGEKRRMASANNGFYEENGSSGTPSAMDSLTGRHRVHDWVKFDVKNLGGMAQRYNPPAAPQQPYYPGGRGYYFKSQIPGRVSRKTLRNMGDFDDDPPLYTSELRGAPRPNVWDRFNDIRETSSNYFFGEPDHHRAQMLYFQDRGLLSLQVPNGATSNGESKSPSSSKISYDSTGPNDERYYVSPCNGPSYDASEVKRRSTGKSLKSEGVKSLQFNVNRHDRGQVDEVDNGGQKMMRSMIEIPINSNQRLKPTTTKTVKKTYIFGVPSQESPKAAPWSKSSPNIHQESSSFRPSKSSKSMKQKHNNSCSDLLDEDPVIPEPDYSPVLFRKASNNGSLWDNAARYKGSLENLIDKKESGTLKKVIEGRPRVKDMVDKLTREVERNRMKQEIHQRLQNSDDNSRNSSSRSSEGLDEADEIYKDLLGVVAENSSPKITKRYGNNSRINHGYGSSEDEPSQRSSRHSRSREIDRNPDPDTWTRPLSRSSKNPYQEVASKQSHFFNSLFPSRANRFGFPVYPQRHFGLPSPEGSGPVSFAGFTPDLTPPFYEPSIDAQEVMTGSSTGFSDSYPPTSLLSAVPKMLKPQSKKKKKKRSFFSFFY